MPEDRLILLFLSLYPIFKQVLTEIYQFNCAINTINTFKSKTINKHSIILLLRLINAINAQ